MCVLFLEQMWLILVGVVLVIVIIIIGEWNSLICSMFADDCGDYLFFF